MAEPWTREWILGLFGAKTLGDRPDTSIAGSDAPSNIGQFDAITARNAKYGEWRSKFNGVYTSQAQANASSSSSEASYRWPTRANLYKTYCLLHAAALWGRSDGPRDVDLFELEIDKTIPGVGGREMVEAVPALKDALVYWWNCQRNVLRLASITQQWAGGCILKLTWNPGLPTAVYGAVLECVEPENFVPVWDPINYDVLYAAKIAFFVPPPVAVEKYGVSEFAAEQMARNGMILVTETWTHTDFRILLGEGTDQRPALLNGKPWLGPNPWRSPATGKTIIPVWYIPRFRSEGFYGDSLVADMGGAVDEYNKALSDIGDALNEASHISGVVADNHAAGARTQQAQSIPLPAGDILNLGITPTGGQQGRYWPVQAPDVPPITDKYVERLNNLLDALSFVTPSMRGESPGAASGYALTVNMLPTLYLLDVMRDAWVNAIVGRGGINECLGTMWLLNQNLRGPTVDVPGGITERALMAAQHMKMRHMVPRDRLQTIQEIAQLAANGILPPRELIARLGDVDDVDEVEAQRLEMQVMQWLWEAGVAGHELKVDSKTLQLDKAAKRQPLPLPEVVGETGLAAKGPITQPGQVKKEPKGDRGA